MTTSQFHALTMLAYALHIGGGAVGLVSGTVAAFARKGGQLHRAAGTIFVVSMVVMAVFAFYLAVVTPDQVNLFISVFVFYLVATAWLTVWRVEGTSGLLEKIALVVAIILLAPFAALAFQLAIGAPPMFKSTVAFKGPVLIALYGFTSVLAIAAFSDAKVVLAGGISGAPRIARHLWRMCVGLTMAAGSAFTNGLPRLLPGPFHVPPEFFLPQFLPLGVLVFWMIRVRLTGWYKRNSVTHASSGPVSLTR
ncbi:MAG: hypothetical protein ACXWLE_00370 [Rhizomicrobium sp.]